MLTSMPGGQSPLPGRKVPTVTSSGDPASIYSKFRWDVQVVLPESHVSSYPFTFSGIISILQMHHA